MKIKTYIISSENKHFYKKFLLLIYISNLSIKKTLKIKKMEEIIKILGPNNTNPIQFLENKKFPEISGIYTYKGNVYVLKDGGDYNFNLLTEKEQKEIINMTLSKKVENK
jgi:hypothetical protein